MATNLRFHIIIGSILAVALVGAFVILNRSESGASEQSTDDAYVQADLTVIAPQVEGVIRQVVVSDNQHVSAGAPLVNIDDRDMRIAVENAQAHVASGQASIDSLQAQLERQQSAIAQARAAVMASSANMKLAEANLSRFTNLARDGSGTILDQQKSQAEWEIQRAASERDKAGLRAAEQQIAILHAELKRPMRSCWLHKQQRPMRISNCLIPKWLPLLTALSLNARLAKAAMLGLASLC